MTQLQLAQKKKEEEIAALKQHEKEIKEKEDELKQKEKDLADASKDMKKQDLEKQKKALQKKKADLAKDKNKTSASLKKAIKRKCPGPFKTPSCVPADPKTKLPLPKGFTEKFNKKYGSNIDWDEISRLEGGSYTEGYTPWRPDMNNKTGTFKMGNAGRTDDGAGKKSSVTMGVPIGRVTDGSGVTVGSGVDLGAGGSNPTAYFKELREKNKELGILTEDEMKKLEKKIEPYMKKRRAESLL